MEGGMGKYREGRGGRGRDKGGKGEGGEEWEMGRGGQWRSTCTPPP